MWFVSRRPRARVPKILSVFILIFFAFLFVQVARENQCPTNRLRRVYNLGGNVSIHETTSGAIEAMDPSDVSSLQRFVPGQPKLLVILAYQRSGSTFLGRFLSRHPDVFYMFEPVDSLYSSVYGTTPGWNVPSDITNLRNGSLRVLPREELAMVSLFLRSLLNCDLPSLPTETFSHSYILDTFTTEFSVGPDYTQCLRLRRKRIRQCSAFRPYLYCGRRFGERPESRQRECRALLRNSALRGSHPQRGRFDGYLNCTSLLRAYLDTDCTPRLLNVCLTQPIRVAKVVRATMASLEPLLRDIPNFRVIHLLRDPRAVALSRTNFHGSGRGLFSGFDRNLTALREARLYCQTAAADLKTSLELERKYPYKMLTIVYEDLVRNVEATVGAMYRFLDVEIPKNISAEISAAANSSYGLTSIEKWQAALSYKTSKDILSTCDEFYRTLNYSWVV